jgi:hypothetical protein
MKKIFLATAFIFTLVVSVFSVSAQTQSRDDVIKQIETKRAELAVLEQKVLAVADSDREEFASFLSQAQTGIIRLLPRETYEGNAKRALALRGGGAYYSFVRKTHEYGFGSDIELAQEQLSAGFAGADYGLLLLQRALCWSIRRRKKSLRSGPCSASSGRVSSFPGSHSRAACRLKSRTLICCDRSRLTDLTP